MTDYKSVKIMLVEDDPGDQKLIKMSLKKQRLSNEVFVKSSAEEALEYLEQAVDKNTNDPIPDLILLDLNMPGIGGKEMLKRLKQNEVLETIPVVILTTSDSDKDILDGFQLQASGYIKKPVSLIEFQEVIATLTEYWFVICKRVPHETTTKETATAVS